MGTALAASVLLLAAGSASASELITNGGFENPNIGVSNYTYPGTTLDGWTYGGSALVNAQGSSAWYGGSAPSGFGGDQFAALQATSSLSTTFTTSGGTLDLSWLNAGRPYFGCCNGDQTYSVEINGTQVGSNFSTLSGESFTPESLTLVGLSKGSYTLTFQGLANADETSFIDNVSITTSAVPEPAAWAVMLVGFGVVGAAMRTQRRAQAAVAA
jgi:hypothetical protein